MQAIEEEVLHMSEKNEYMTLDEAAETLGVKRATIYNYIKALGIKTHKFKLNRSTYLAKADVERMREAKEKPWLAGPDDKDNESLEDVA
jgi:excisionase family DNA binding protein